MGNCEGNFLSLVHFFFCYVLFFCVLFAWHCTLSFFLLFFFVVIQLNKQVVEYKKQCDILTKQEAEMKSQVTWGNDKVLYYCFVRVCGWFIGLIIRALDSCLRNTKGTSCWVLILYTTFLTLAQYLPPSRNRNNTSKLSAQPDNIQSLT